MPTPKALSKYPAEYFTLFERVIAGEEVTLNFTTKADAKRHRAHLYAFRTAIYTDPEAHPTLTLGASAVEFHVILNTLIITRPHNDTSVQSAGASAVS